MAIDPQSVEALLCLANAWINAASNLWLGEQDELLRHAEEAVGRALTIDPRNARAFTAKSRILAYSRVSDYRGLIDQAIDAAETAVSLDHNLAEAYNWLGRLYAKAGHPERTEAVVLKAMRLNPRDANIASSLYNLGTAELQMGRYDAAIATFRKSVIENPSFAVSWANLAAAYLGAGRDTEARNALTEANKLDYRQSPEQIEEQLKLMRAELGLLRRGLWPNTVYGRDRGRHSEALHAFQREENLPSTGILDEVTLARLALAATSRA